MEYRLSEQQQMVQKTVSSILEALLPSDQFIKILETEGFTKKSWGTLADGGWLGMLDESSQTPDDEAFSLMDLVCVSEAIGEKLYPGPYSLVAAFVVPVLSQILSPEEQEKWLQPIVEGEKLITAGLPVAQTNHQEVTVKWGNIRITEDSDNVYINGQYCLVPFAQFADAILLPVENTSKGISVAIVEKNAEGLAIEAKSSVDLSRRVATVKFDNFKIEKNAFIGGWDADHRQVLQKKLASYVICLNSEMIGGARIVLQKTVDYVKDRKQFGQPIGAFQVLKHKLADMSKDIENAKTFNFYTTWKLLNEPEGSLVHVTASRVYAAKMFKDVCEKAIQLHGGMGFTWEDDVHFYYKSALYHQNHLASSRTLKRFIFNHLVAAE